MRIPVLSPVVRIVILLAAFRPASAQDAKTQEALQKADAYLTSKAAEGSLRGSVLVGIEGNIAFEKGYGLADEEWNARNSPLTKFRIGSLTKQFTAACILLLQEHHQLHLQDPISKYVSDLPENWRPITIHQLLTHTSGIPNYPGMPHVDHELNRTGATPREILAVAATKPLEFKPGTQLRYTNTGYVLLGMVIEKVSGASFADFLQQNIFTPLEMTNSGYDNAATILKERASGYMVKDGHLRNADFIDMSIPYAAGSLYSTVEDLYRWNEALAGKKLLPDASLQQMFSVYPETLLQGMHYGYGVVIAQRFGRLLYHHGGGVNGFETVIQRYPKERICIIVLENLDPSEPWTVADHIASDLFHEPLPRKK
jgi:D-alanyl-D-alanine carboxypeptidase